METQNPNPQEEKQLSELQDSELLERYNNAEEETEEFAGVKAELVRRGYSFEAEDEEKAKNEAAVATLQSFTVTKEPYSTGGNIFWEASLTIISIAGAIYFLASMESAGGNIGTKTIITALITVLFLSSIGVLVGGLRRLANKIANPKLFTHSTGYVVLTFLWSACVVGAMYYTIKNFVEIVEFSFKYALISAVPTLVGAIVAFAFASMFFLLSKELER